MHLYPASCKAFQSFGLFNISTSFRGANGLVGLNEPDHGVYYRDI